MHQALSDLDDATAVVPTPVQTAITAELETEARGLRDTLAEYTEGVELPETDTRRRWDFEAPFVVVGDVDGLSDKDRDRLNRREQGGTSKQLRAGAADLRLLLDAYTQSTNDAAMLLIDNFSITDDPFEVDQDRFFLNVEAPMPNGDYGRDGWAVEICRWVPDPEDEDSASGEQVLRCNRSAPPTTTEITDLLNRSGGRQEQLAAWAKIPVGDALTGTSFVVTERYED